VGYNRKRVDKEELWKIVSRGVDKELFSQVPGLAEVELHLLLVLLEVSEHNGPLSPRVIFEDRYRATPFGDMIKP
jgi:hypothetical protein